MKNIVILYHKNCPDGFSGAWAAWKKFGKKADYFGVEYQQPPLRGLKNKEIYIIDFCYQKSEIMKRLLHDNKKVVVIDHHITLKELSKISSGRVFDLNHSGAVLAWKYFFPKKATPKLLLHIEDVDLWKFKLPHTKELMSALALCSFNFKVWNKIAVDWQNPKSRKKYIKEGEIILKYEQKIIERLLKSADKAKFGNYKAAVVNSPVLQSEIGNALVKSGYQIGVIWSQKNNKKRISLRSNGKTDVSKLAQKYGGGGHKAASGFALKIDKPFPWKIAK